MIIDRLLTALSTDDDAGKHDLSRRTLLKAGLASGGGLLLSVHMPAFTGHAATSPADFAPNAFIRIAPSGQVTFVSRDEDPRDYKVSFEKIHRTLGFETSMTVPDGVAELIAALSAGRYEDPYDRRYRNVD